MNENKLNLYEHNLTAYQKVSETYQQGENIVGIVHATGTGKSYIALNLAYDNKDKQILYVVPSNGIIEHIKKIIENHPNISLESDFPNLNFRTYQSFINMSYEELSKLDTELLILDEFHHLGAPVWGSRINTIVETHPDMKVFGMTAYTVRDRGSQFERDMANPDKDELFSNKIVSRYDLCDAMIDGVLPKPNYKMADTVLTSLTKELEDTISSMSKSSKKYQEYKSLLESAKKRISEAPQLEKVMRKYLKPNGKYIYFCPTNAEEGANDIKKIQEEVLNWFQDYLNEEDIIFYISTSEMGLKGKQNREAFYEDKTLDGLDASNKLRIMFAINQYNEGVHAPDIDGVIMGRGTTSDIIYFEQLGRALSVGGNIQEKYQELSKYEKEELIKLCQEKELTIYPYATKEELIETLLSPIVIDLTNNFEFIKELENDLKDRYIQIQTKKSSSTKESNLKNPSFDIEIANQDIFSTLYNLKEKVTPLTWEEMYKLASNYSKEYHNLEVPNSFKTINGYEYNETGYDLPRWLYNQKKYYRNGVLSQEKTRKLLDIGINFTKSNDDAWEEMYELAKVFLKKYGHLEIPKTFKTINGYEVSDTEDAKKLGIWIRDQRKRYNEGKMREDRYQKLLLLGMRFQIKDYEKTWNNWYQLAKSYYQEHGNLEIKFNYIVDNDKNLGLWIRTQRREHTIGIMREDRYQKLLAIGMRFEIQDHDKEWEEMYNLAKNYYETYHNLEIKSNFKTIDGITEDKSGKTLGRWICDQRTIYKKNKLPSERKEKLLSIGMRFETRDNEKEWEKMYQLAKEYYLEHGNIDISDSYKTESGISLGRWLNNQKNRYYKNKLSSERIEKLSSIGMNFEIKDNEEHWEYMYNLAKNYFLHYGNLKVHSNFKTVNGYTPDYESENSEKLGDWIHRQRLYYVRNTLRQDRQEKLELIGMIFEVKNNQQIIIDTCEKYHIDYQKNISSLKHISYQELISKIKYLIDNNLPLTNNDNLLHEIFDMSNLNMLTIYGISLEELITTYYIDERKNRGKSYVFK